MTYVKMTVNHYACKVDLLGGNEWQLGWLYLFYFIFWFCWLYGEFGIDFALAHLERLVRAFLGQQAKRLKDEIPKITSEKVAKLQPELKKCEEYKGSSSKSKLMGRLFEGGFRIEVEGCM